MIYRITLFLITILSIQIVQAQNPYKPNNYQEVWAPEPRDVDAGVDDKTPPSDAIVLFDGSNLDHWVSTRKKLQFNSIN